MAEPSTEWAARIDAQMDSLDASIDGLQTELDRCIDATAAQDELEMQAALEALAETCEEMASTLAAVRGELEAAAELDEGDLAEWLDTATARCDAMESIVERIKDRVEECLDGLS